MDSFARLAPFCQGLIQTRNANLCALLLYSFGVLALAGILMRDLNRYSFILTLITTVFLALGLGQWIWLIITPHGILAITFWVTTVLCALFALVNVLFLIRFFGVREVAVIPAQVEGINEWQTPKNLTTMVKTKHAFLIILVLGIFANAISVLVLSYNCIF